MNIAPLTYKYRIKQTISELNQITSTKSNAYYIGLPESGIKRTISESAKLLSRPINLSVIDLSLIAITNVYGHFSQLLSSHHPNEINYVLIENLPICNQSGRELFTTLEKLRDQYPKATNYIYHFNTNPYWYGIPESPRNSYYFSLASFKEFPLLIDHFSSRFKQTVNRSSITNLYQITGGHPYLLKKIFELNLINLPVDQVVDHLHQVALALVNQLHLSEVLRLKSIFSQSREFISHFQSLGLIDQKLEFTSLSLKTAIDDFSSTQKLSINATAKTIFIGDHRLDSYFSSYELDILFYLEQHHSIDRDHLIELCWGKISSTVSDSAVDKMISRLRQKLVELGLSKDIISTRRGRGFDFKP